MRDFMAYKATKCTIIKCPEIISNMPHFYNKPLLFVKIIISYLGPLMVKNGGSNNPTGITITEMIYQFYMFKLLGNTHK